MTSRSPEWQPATPLLVPKLGIMIRTVSFCLEVNSSMSNDVEEEGGKIDGQEVAQESSTKDNKD